MVTEALVGVVNKGTAKGLGLTNTISAGKTGTTDEKKDGWFVGYTPIIQPAYGLVMICQRH